MLPAGFRHRASVYIIEPMLLIVEHNRKLATGHYSGEVTLAP